MQWVKKRQDDSDRTLEVSLTHWTHMKKHELDIRKAIKEGLKLELPLIDTGNKTIQHQFLEANKTWYIAFTTYFNGTRNLNKKYTMNILPEAFLTLMGMKETIDCLVEHFAKERKRDQAKSAPKVELKNRYLAAREFITYSWRHVDRKTDQILRNDMKRYWSEELATERAHSALPSEEMHKVSIQITKHVSEMPDQFTLTKYCAFLLVYLNIRKKNNIKPCRACKNQACNDNVVFPCLECLEDDIPRCKFWRVEPELRQLVDSYEFKTALGDFLEYIRNNFCQTKMYGRHLAEAFVTFSHPRTVKTDFWFWLNENQHNAILSNLRHAWIMACGERQEERQRNLTAPVTKVLYSQTPKRSKNM